MTHINPYDESGYEPASRAHFDAIDADQSLADPMSGAEVDRIAAEFRAANPGAPQRCLTVCTARPGIPGPLWVRSCTGYTVTPDQLPDRLARCRRDGEEPYILTMLFSHRGAGTFIQVVKDVDDYFWAWFSADRRGADQGEGGLEEHYRCDQLSGLLSLIRHVSRAAAIFSVPSPR